MKGICIVVILIACISLGHSAPKSVNLLGLDGTLSQIGSALGKYIEEQINGVLIGQKSSDETIKKQLKQFAAGLPLLPNPVYLKGNLDNAVAFGLEDLIPDIDFNIIKKTLGIKFNLPQIRIEGDYNLSISPDQEFESYILLNGNGLGHIQINNLQLSINSKVKGNIITGYKIDTLDYILDEFSISTHLDKFSLLNNVPIEEYVEPFLNWYLHKELINAETQLHEPLVTYAISVIDKILCPIC